MGKEWLYKRKFHILILFALVIAIVTVTYGWLWYNMDVDENTDVAIDLSEYRTYDKYGFAYEGNEGDLFKALAELFPIEKFELSLESEAIYGYTDLDSADMKKVGDMLPQALFVRTIGYREGHEDGQILLRSYYFNYLDVSGNRVNIEYFEDGQVVKTVGFIEDGKVVAVSSNLTKTILHTILQPENNLFTSEGWQAISGREYFFDNGWTGTGLYFMQVGNQGYCISMTYGSGVPVVNHYISLVQMDEQGQLFVELPMVTSDQDDMGESPGKQPLVKLPIDVISGGLLLQDTRYDLREDTWGYDALREMYESGWFQETKSLPVPTLK